MSYKSYNTLLASNTVEHYFDIACLFTTFYILGITLFSVLYIYNKKQQRQQRQHKLVIVRGLPGSGKTRYVDYAVENSSQSSKVISMDDYIQEDQVTHRQAHIEALMECLCSLLRQRYSTIYIEGIFSQQWEYEPFQKIGYLNNYLVEVVETPCTNLEIFELYTSKTHHIQNKKYFHHLYQNWEQDPSADWIVNPVKDMTSEGDEHATTAETTAETTAVEATAATTASNDNHRQVQNKTLICRYNLRSRKR